MSTAKIKRIGPVMLDVARFVSANPGCPKLHAALHAGPNGSTHYGYNAVNRALGAGLIEDRSGAGASSYKLYVTEAGLAAIRKGEE